LPDFTNGLIVETRMGQIKVVSHISSDGITEEKISLSAIDFKPKLPTGMSVKKCTAVILIIEGLVEIQKLSLKLSIENKVLGHPCMGQCLDAQEWKDNGKLVVIGSEDGEALGNRFPKLGFEDKVVVSFSDSSLTLNLDNLSELKRPSFHFIIAENDDPELVEASAWFAVDQSHSYLLSQ
jgi:hypothetical protein